MPNRPKKQSRLDHPLFDLNTLSEADKPSGEDFFVISFAFDDLESPTWELRQSIMGSWAQVISSARLLAATSGRQRGKLLCLQGQKARDYLLLGFQNEARYQQERSSQPNN